MFYKIKYEYNGKIATTTEQPIEKYENQFFEQCINRIDSLTRAGATIIETSLHKTK